jgi:hypothetical protein
MEGKNAKEGTLVLSDLMDRKGEKKSPVFNARSFHRSQKSFIIRIEKPLKPGRMQDGKRTVSKAATLYLHQAPLHTRLLLKKEF